MEVRTEVKKEDKMEKWKRWINTRDEETINKFINDLTNLKELKYPTPTPKECVLCEQSADYDELCGHGVADSHSCECLECKVYLDGLEEEEEGTDTESEITYEDTGFTVPEAESEEEDNICEICGEICDEEKDVIFKCEECGSNPSHSECYDNGGRGSNLLSVQEGWACDDHYVPAHIADEWCSRG